MKRYLIGLAAVLVLACSEEKKPVAIDSSTTTTDSKYKKIEVIDAIPGGGYTYVQALQDGDTIWMAMSATDVVKGNTYYYETAMEMKNFPSKELNRTFASIYFLDRLLKEPHEPLPGEEHTQSPIGKNEKISFPAEEGIISIADLFNQREDYAGKTVTVRGQVTKVNNQIMNRNWVHIQDGTSTDEAFDLTITTEANVNLGDVVKFTGTVAVDKDFTLGYKYKLLLENATVPDPAM